MKLSTSTDPNYYIVSNLCKTLSKYLFTLEGTRRVSDGWLVKSKDIPELFRRAKLTGFYTTYDFECADNELKEKIAKVLGIKVKKQLISTSTPFSSLHLLPSAPEYVVKAVWKAMAVELHPDRGGDPEAFMKAKEAYNAITKKGG